MNRLIVAYGAHGNSRGMVNQTGGTISVKDENGAVYFGSMEYGGTGVYNLSGGKLTAPSVKYGHTNTTAAFNISGTGEAVISGAVAVPTRLAGGTLTAGSITDTLTHSNGVFAPGGVGTYGTTAVTGTYISETGNLALGKPASQVNNYQNGVLYHAGDAVDGNMNTFSHTDPASGTNQWWQVMFSEHGNQSFDFVKVFNRGDDGWRLTEQGSGFHFELYSGTLEDPGEMIERSERFDSTSWSQGKELALNFEKEGNILRLVRDFPENFPLSGDNLTLNLSEVQILSNAAEIQMDLKSDASEFDKILIDGGSMDVSYAFLDLTIDDLVNVAPGTEWELFSTVNNGTLTGDFLAVSLNGMELTEGWEFADGILAFNGTRNQVPEPGTMVLLALGLGGLFLV